MLLRFVKREGHCYRVSAFGDCKPVVHEVDGDNIRLTDLRADDLLDPNGERPFQEVHCRRPLKVKKAWASVGRARWGLALLLTILIASGIAAFAARRKPLRSL